MVQLSVLSGKQAGARWAARRFPVRIGRAPAADLRLEDDGIWDEHLRLDFRPGDGFMLSVPSEAGALVNGQAVQEASLRSGDLIQIGSVTLQFWLAETRQTNLRVREWLTWAAVAAICLGQIALIYLLSA